MEPALVDLTAKLGYSLVLALLGFALRLLSIVD
jgi:hypothetical protein